MKFTNAIVIKDEKIPNASTFILTEKDQKHLQKLMDRLISLRKLSYQKYKYNRYSLAAEDARERVNNFLVKIEEFLSKTLDMKCDEVERGEFWENLDISFLADVQGPNSAEELWAKGAEEMLRSKVPPVR